jgi:DNA polymerase-3 subunit delta'
MIIGHQKQLSYLKRLAESGKIPHALLFSGPEHLGKKKIALEFVKLINGAELNENHPDLILIGPPTKNMVGGGEIQISQIKELIQKLSLKSYSAPFKCAILDKAHLMNQEAQNCFLKTLEEPKGKTLLILISESPEMLFPTIRSRCEIIKFFPVPIAEIENYLETQGISKEKSQEIAKLSLGRPGLAIDFISNPQKLENYQRVIKKLIEIPNLPLAGRFQYVQELAKESSLREILEIWLSYFRNILLSKLKTNQKLLTSDINRLREIQETNFLISTTNVNPRLILEILMLEL